MLRPLFLSLCLATPVAAQSLLEFPDHAERATHDIWTAGHYLIPTGPWTAGGVPAFEANGTIRQEVWQIADFTAGTGVLMAVLTAQLGDAGFEPLFSCTTRVCGGFDFRFALDIAPEPDMHVNLSDFAFHAARRDGEDGPEYTALLVSEGGGTGFVQSVHVHPGALELSDVTLSSRAPEATSPVPVETGDLSGTLLSVGRAPLPGVSFAYGSTNLEDPQTPILRALANFLFDHPDIRLTLVGHTDAEGGLQSNITVSRARADAVRRILVEDFGISAERLSAEGVGYLMPLALNTTQDGRDINRRVEAVVINTD